MAVKRIVANIAAGDVGAAAAFYREMFDIEVAMDLGWIVTLGAAGQAMTPQLNIMTEGGSGTPVPDMSIEVDDIDAVLALTTAAGHAPTYGPIDEPWGVRRFFIVDPAGRLVNVVQHREQV